jgi:hypothetical protein
MLNYKEKYLKYKYKYNLLKDKINVLKGGNIEIVDLDKTIIADKIKEYSRNLGQHNCGIVFIDKYVVKCIKIIIESELKLESEKDMSETIIKIEKINNDLDGLFSKYYKWADGNIFNFIEITDSDETKKYAKCIIIERLDGDLTDYLIKNSYIKEYGNLDGFDFYYERLPKTNIEFIYDKIDSFENKNFKKIINNVKKYIFEICYSLNVKIIFLHHELVKKGWKYCDLKFDNIGYKIINSEIKLLFIDEESGLFIINNDSFTEYLNLHQFRIPLGNYGIFGQYNLSSIYSIDFSSFYPGFDNKQSIIDKLLNGNLFLYSDSDDFFNWIKFIKPSRNEFFVIQFIMGFYRLVFFDDNGRHMSNPLFNTDLNQYKIDELFYSIESLYQKLNEVYPDLSISI